MQVWYLYNPNLNLDLTVCFTAVCRCSVVESDKKNAFVEQNAVDSCLHHNRKMFITKREGVFRSLLMLRFFHHFILPVWFFLSL